MIIQGENRSYNDGVSGVYPDGIHIFHPTDGNSVVVGISHDLKLDFLVTSYTLFNQHLVNGRKPEGIGADLYKLLLVVRKSAARSAERKSRTQYNGIADFLGSPLCVLQVVSNLRGDDRLTDGLTHLLKKFTILGTFNALAAGSEQFDSALTQDTLPFELHCEVQPCLSANAGDNSIRSFIAQYFGYIVECQWLHVDLVSYGSVRHDGGRIGVDQHYFVTFLLKRQAGLRARIIKLRRLADYNRSRADDKYFFNIRSLCHIHSPHSRLLSRDRPSVNTVRRLYDLQRVLPGPGKEIPQG